MFANQSIDWLASMGYGGTFNLCFYYSLHFYSGVNYVIVVFSWGLAAVEFTIAWVESHIGLVGCQI